MKKKQISNGGIGISRDVTTPPNGRLEHYNSQSSDQLPAANNIHHVKSTTDHSPQEHNDTVVQDSSEQDDFKQQSHLDGDVFVNDVIITRL